MAVMIDLGAIGENSIDPSLPTGYCTEDLEECDLQKAHGKQLVHKAIQSAIQSLSASYTVGDYLVLDHLFTESAIMQARLTEEFSFGNAMYAQGCMKTLHAFESHSAKLGALDLHDTHFGVGDVFADALASAISHKLPIKSALGVFSYGVAKNNEAPCASEAVAGGIAHLVLDTAVESAAETIADIAIEAGIEGTVVTAFIPKYSVVPVVIGAHVVRIISDIALKNLPKEENFPHFNNVHLYAGDCACGSVLEARILLSALRLPSVALEKVHHLVVDFLAPPLNRIGINNENMGKVIEIFQAVGESILENAEAHSKRVVEEENAGPIDLEVGWD